MRTAKQAVFFLVIVVFFTCLLCYIRWTRHDDPAVDQSSTANDRGNSISSTTTEQDLEKDKIADNHNSSDNTEFNKTNSITPEEFGAEGDGITDDTEAFEECLNSSDQNVLLTGKYRITRNISTTLDKHFYAPSEKGEAGAVIICEPADDYKTLTFMGNVTFDNVDFSSTIRTTGESPHGETYRRTSNKVFVEVWNKNGTFKNCTFTNALIAIRGRKSTDSTVIPKNISISGCSFTECKIPIQGYGENTTVSGSSFLNDGDLYGGDHCVYMERYGCKSLKVTNCRVDTKNSESGHAFQIYGEPKPGDPIPELWVENCQIYANGITSSSAANVTVENSTFYEQTSDQYILLVEEGTATVRNCDFHHAYAFSYADSSVKPYAENCTFERNLSFDSEGCNFPQESIDCTYINWGGIVRLADTKFTGCTFSYTEDGVPEGLYINNPKGYSVYMKNTRFQSGVIITNNDMAVKEKTSCNLFN